MKTQVKFQKIVSIMLVCMMMVANIIFTPQTVEAAGEYTLTLNDVTFDTTTGEITDYLNTAEKIIIPASFNVSGTDYPVMSIGASAFKAKSLTSVTIPNNVTSIGASAFEGNYLTSITIPDSVTSIGDGAFKTNTFLISITIPDNVTIIGNEAFAYNFSLANITLGNSIVSIGEKAFYKNNNSIANITIPASVRSIGANAFSDNRAIGSENGSIFLPTTSVIGYDTPVWTNGDGTVVTKITYDTTDKSYTKIIMPIDYTITYNVDGGKNGSNPETYTIEDSITLADPTKAEAFFDGWYSDSGCTAGNEVVEIPLGSTGDKELWAKWKTYYTLTLDDVSFDETTGTITAYNNTTETDIIIPATFNVSETAYDVINIGANAFESMNLTGVVLSDCVKDIGTSAFKDNSLVRIVIPDNVENIGASAFENNTLTILAIPNSVMSIGANAFAGNSGLSPGIVLPVASATGYNETTWTDDTSLVTAINNFTKSYTKILGTPITYNITYNLDSGKNDSINPATYDIETATVTLASPTRTGYTFNGWYSESEFTNRVTEIALGSTGDKVLFAKWTIASYTLTLSDVIFDEGTGTIIAYLSSARDIIIPASFNVRGRNYPVTNIGDVSFYTKSLVSVSIPNSVIDIGTSAFKQNQLNSVTIGDSVKHIKWGAFDSNNLTTISLPNSLESIGYGAFYNNDLKLTSIDLPDNGIWTAYDLVTNSKETVTAITNFYASYWKTVSGGSTSGAGGSGSSLPKTKTPTEKLEDAINGATPNREGIVEALIELEADSDGAYSFRLPKNFVGEHEVKVTVVAGDVEVTLSNTMFNSWENNIQIAIEPVEIDDLNLSDETKKIIGDLPVYDISLEINGKKVEWESDTDIEIAIGLDEDSDLDEHKFVAVYIDEVGNVQFLNFSLLRDGVINFSTRHLSDYAIVYMDKTFEDLDAYSWAKEAIEALSARRVINGTSDTTFSPALSITRANFVTLIVRYFGFAGDTEENFSDVADGKYYTDSIAIAKDLGIIKGSSDNLFNPTRAITRQDMMVILMRALVVAGHDEELKLLGKPYESFDDSNCVANYAVESVDYMVKAGIINGRNNKINPTSEITRAEVAQALYNLLKLLGE